MTLPHRSPSPKDSLLARWDERWKLAGLGLLAISASFITSFPLAIAALVVAVIVLAVGRVSISSLLSMTGLLAMGLLPLAIAIPFLSERGWQPGAILVVRGLAVGWILFAAVNTTRPDRLFTALGKLGLPRLFVQLTQFAFRYAMLLTAEAKRVRVAMRARGFHFGPTPRSVTMTGQLIGCTIARSQLRAETVAHAMAARGFSGEWKSLTPFQTRLGDVMGFVSCVVLTGLFLALAAYFRG